MRLHYLAAAAAALLPLAGCDSAVVETTNCLSYAPPGVRVTLVDADGAYLSDANLILRDGSYVEQMTIAPGSLEWGGAQSRPGVYSLTVEADGFSSYQQTGIEITQNGSCVGSAFLLVRLSRDRDPLLESAIGPALVNAPVAPEAIYIGVGGAFPGVGVLDLNGFGQGTGNPATTRFPFNPNVGQPGVTPPLSPGVTTLDAGGRGALTLTQNSVGSPLLVGPSILQSAADMALGHPLDLVYNNESINVNVSPFNHINPATGLVGEGNTIMVAPHPNPPRIVLPAPNPAEGIFSEEPTVATSVGNLYPFLPVFPICLASPLNVLQEGNPFSSNQSQIGLFDVSYPGAFFGPQPPPQSPPPPPAFCPYVIRQQIGHFLYVLDDLRDEVVVLNSNRFVELARIPVQGGTSLAMSPNLRYLAVSSYSTGTVGFIDVLPGSANFHQVVAVTAVGAGPRGMAWQPEGEELLVCNELGNSVSFIEPLSFTVRKTIGGIRAPRDVAVTARQDSFAFQTGTYFAYILTDADQLAIFESGPTSIGPDGLLGTLPETFAGATTVQPDPGTLHSSVWIAHRDSFGLGQVSEVRLVGSPVGPQPPVPGNNETPGVGFRGRDFDVVRRIGGLPAAGAGDLLAGNAVVDLAFDEIRNLGGWPDHMSNVVGGLTYPNQNGKGLVKLENGIPAPASSPLFLFVASADVGVVDVVDLSTARIITRISTPGVTSLCHYWRQ